MEGYVMTVEQIKQAVDDGRDVRWASGIYKVVKDYLYDLFDSYLKTEVEL